jgi:bacterioferritin-associated ferredoxin
MVVDKAFVCLCEDVTVDELRNVMRMGYRDIEEIKRITGIGTGPCQGKQCLHVLRQLLAEDSGVRVDEIPLTTLRPPAVPIRFGQWESDEAREGTG